MRKGEVISKILVSIFLLRRFLITVVFTEGLVEDFFCGSLIFLGVALILYLLGRQYQIEARIRKKISEKMLILLGLTFISVILFLILPLSFALAMWSFLATGLLFPIKIISESLKNITLSAVNPLTYAFISIICFLNALCLHFFESSWTVLMAHYSLFLLYCILPVKEEALL